MNNITIKILLIAIVANCSVHAQQVKWVKRIGGSGDDRNLAIGVDKARNVYLGNTNMTATSTNYNGSCTITGGSSNWDAIYYTADTLGVCVNSKMFAKSASEIRSIAVDDSQYVYITGYFSGSKTFCSSLTATIYDVFVVKQTKNGTCQWSAKGGGSGSDYGWDIKVDGDGNVYVTGQFQGTATFGSYTLVSQGGSDGFVVKYNRTGTVQWAKRFGGKKEDFGYGVSNIENGFLYITGTFDSIANFGTDTMNAMGVAKLFLAKVDVDGNFYWVKGGGSNIYSPVSSRVIQDRENNVFLPMVCDSGGTFGSFVSPSTCNVLIRCNASGDVIWGTALSKQTNEYAQPEVQIFDSAIYFLGTYTAASTIGNETITPVGGADIFLTKIDYNGKPLWVESFGSTSADHGLGLAIDTFGAAYITGDFRGTASFGDSSITASGNMDAFVAKIITTLPITAVGGGNNTVCNGNSFDVTFKANRTYSSGNVFTVQLSDSTGSFSIHTNIGTDTATTGSTINCTVPGYVTAGLNYRLRVVSSNPAETGEEYRSSIRIATDTPAVPSLVTTGTFKLCGGKSIRLNATSANSIITWFTHPTGGVAVGESESGADFLFVPDTTATYYAEARNGCVQTTRTATATVKVFDIPGIPANPTSNSPQCVNTGVTLTRSGSPAAGVSWFWQNTGGGTDTGYSASTRVVSATGTYYLRARNDSALCFSTGSGSVAITANANPSSPTSVTPSSGTGVCAGGSATLRGVMSGSVIDWYKVPTGGTLAGTSNSNVNFSTTPDTSTYYYAEARIAATGCVSTSRTATAYITVNPLPTAPGDPTSNSPQCSSPGVTLTRAGSPPGGVGWYWQTSPTGVVTSSSGATYTATASGTYYIRARNSTTACWGTGAGSLAVTTIASPANPSNPTSNSPQCANVGVTLTRSSTPPASVSWYWQTSSTGTSTTYGDSTYLATTGGTKHLRARNDTSLCWSAGNGTLAVTVNALPAAPTSVTPSSGVTVCQGSAVTVKATSAGNSIDWYFQSAGGTLVGSSASNTNYTVYPDTTGRYYAEARTGAGCTSATRSQTAVVTANPNPAAPTAPAAQSVCSDSTHVFTFSSIAAGSGGNQIEWARNSAFTGSTIVTSPATIYDTVASGVSDTIWIRSRASGTGCVSGGVVMVGRVNGVPEVPKIPAPQAASSDTAHLFVFENIRVGFWANAIQWSFDSSFTSVNTDTSGFDLHITVAPASDTVVWLRCVDTVNGCVSSKRNLMAIVSPVWLSVPKLDTLRYVCTGTSAEIAIPNSLVGKRYDLRIDTLVISSLFGNDSSLSITTNAIDTGTAYNVLATDTSLNTAVIIDSNIVILPLAAVDTPVFSDGKKLVLISDTVQYTAIAGNSMKVIYSLTGGGADIDSQEGYVYNIAGNFTVRASATGIEGCGSSYADFPVVVTTVAPPIVPEKKYVVVDSPQVLTITLDSIWAGAGGDEIEWAFNRDFNESQIVASPAVISLQLETEVDTMIWVRSRNKVTGQVSIEKQIPLETDLTRVAAGLLDKSKWKLAFNDEFIYGNPLPKQNVTFGERWSLNFLWDDAHPADCVNHALWKETPPNNSVSREWTNILENGDGEEVTFSGTGLSAFKTSNIGTSEFLTPCTAYYAPNNTKYYPAHRFNYKAAQITMQARSVDISKPGMIEVRCKTPSGIGVWPAFWFYSGVEYDVMENPIEVSEELVRASHNIHENVDSFHSCGKNIWKRTPCGFTEDYHTYGMVFSLKKLSFYIDGKQTFSVDRDVADPFPRDTPIMNSNATRLMLGIGVLGNAADSVYEMLVDYVRYYRPASAPNYLPTFLQKGNGYIGKTLESINPDGIDPDNNKMVRCWKGFFSGPTDMVVNQKMSTTGTGQDLGLYYKIIQNQMAFISKDNNNRWLQKRILPQVLVAQPFGWGTGYAMFNTNPEVKGAITPVSKYLIYYQSVNNTLKYYQYFGGYIDGTARRDNNPLRLVANCDGYIKVDNQGRVYYKGTDNNLWNWTPGNGALISLTNGSSPGSLSLNGDVVGAFVMANCGCLAFYRDANNNLRQLSWWNGWRDVGVVVSNGEVTNHIAIDEKNSRVFFIGNDGAIYYYVWDYSASNPEGLVRLGFRSVLDPNNNGSVCPFNKYYNAASDLVLSNDGNIVYYKGTDDRLWYYFNDGEQTQVDYVLNNGIISFKDISHENWNKTPLKYGSNIDGPIAIEALNEGRLFYTDRSYKVVHEVSWIDADKSVSCPQTYYGNYNSYKTDGEEATAVESKEDTVPVSKPDGVSVFPNPSNNVFTFYFSKTPGASSVDLRIYDLHGMIVYSSKREVSDTKHVVWNAADVQNGVYCYKILMPNGQTHTGKLIKL
jgi:hypothetical protein